MTHAENPHVPQTRIGISGWTYGPWRGTFYPKGHPHKRELEYASRRLNSIEINGSFYSLQRPSSYQGWYDATPDEFVFSVKGGRFITHMKKLKDVETPLANFFASGLLCLKEKLGPLLWQLPPVLAFDPDRIESFFKLLPHTTKDAATLAKRHDQRLKGRSWTKADADRPVRHTMEVRHESFRDERFVRLLRKYNVAMCVADTAGKWPLMEDVTADFVYVRLHGDEQLYVSGYTDTALDFWSARLDAWRKGRQPEGARLAVRSLSPPRRKSRDVFVYCDNDVKVRAPYDAMNLAARLGVCAPPQDCAPDVATISEAPRARWPGFRRSEPKG